MRLFPRYGIILSLILSFFLKSTAQTHRIDSLLTDLKNITNDSFTAFTLASLANEYYAYDTIKSNQYLQRAFEVSKKLNWHNALGNYYQIKGMIRQQSSNDILAHVYLDSAIFHFKEELKILRDKEQIGRINLFIATCLGQKADILISRGKGEEAIPIFLDALEKWKSSDQPKKMEAVGTYYSKIATTYYGLKQFDKALEYDKLSLSQRLMSDNEEAIAWAYVYVCDDFIALKQMDSCLRYLNLAKPIVFKINNHRLNVQYYNKMGQISVHGKDYRIAITHYEKCVAEATFTNTKIQILSNQRMIAVCYVRLGEYNNARKYLLMALPQAIEGNYMKSKMEILQDLVTTEERSGNIKEAYDYQKQVNVLRDSLNQENSKKSIAEIENKYQASEKAREIDQLNADKKIQSLSIQQKSTLNYFLIGSLAISLVVGFLIYRNLRHRQNLSRQEQAIQLQQIRVLEKDKQLVAVDSMLKGQEEERSRLAKDLHDGLGGLLSGVKFSLTNMKHNLIVTPDNMAVFERSLDMIDTSIKELRRVAHNMMPEILLKFGLDEAVKEYCNTVNATGLVKLNYQSHGLENRIEKSEEIIVYRIIQELLNNILKHSGATEGFVQLIRENSRLNVVVEDNGRGFDPDLPANSKGAGLSNIRSRVDYLKGQLDVHSEPGKGTLVNIEFKI